MVYLLSCSKLLKILRLLGGAVGCYANKHSFVAQKQHYDQSGKNLVPAVLLNLGLCRAIIWAEVLECLV